MPNSSKTDFQPVSLFYHHFVSCAIPESCVRGCSINFVASKLSLVFLSLATGSLKSVSNCLSFLLLLEFSCCCLFSQILAFVVLCYF